jgi:sporulation protein YlmC with PRC-barrel domain
MPNLKPIILISIVALVAGVPAMMASAQEQPRPQQQTSPPAATTPAPRPEPAVKPQADATAPAQSAGKLKGMNVVSKEGERLGTVQEVETATNGTVQAIRIKTGGFLGFGGKTVAVPESKFTRVGNTIQLTMTSEEVSKLPAVKGSG